MLRNLGGLTLGGEVEARLARKLPEAERNARFQRRVKEVTHWHVESDSIPEGWSGRLRSVNGQLYDAGESDTFWILRFDERKHEVVLADSIYGRAPISDQNRPQYIKGLRALRVLLAEEDGAQQEADALEWLPDAEQFIRRQSRQDQADWFTVCEITGHPDSHWSDEVRGLLRKIRHSLRVDDGDRPNLVEQLRSRLSAEDVERWLVLIENSAKTLSMATAFVQQPRADSSDGDGEEDGEDKFIVSLKSRRKTERASREHEETRAALEAYLSQRGYVVQYNQLIDAFARIRSGPAIFEMKSINEENELTQVRGALSQLKDYRYFHEELREARLWAVFSKQLTGGRGGLRFTDCLRYEGIRVLWLEDGVLGGPAFGDL